MKKNDLSKIVDFLIILSALLILRGYAPAQVFNAGWVGIIAGGIVVGVKMWSRKTDCRHMIRFLIKLTICAVVPWLVSGARCNIAITVSLTMWVLSLCWFLSTDDEKERNCYDEK